MNLPPQITVNVQEVSGVPWNISHLSDKFFFDYFSVKYLKRKFDDKLCGIVQWLKWNADKKELQVPNDRIQLCLADKSSRFVFQPCELVSRIGGSHANAILIDKTLKTAERFEPHGSRAYDIFRDFRYELLDELLEDYFNQNGIQYLKPAYFCPYIGPQKFESSRTSGYCAAWSLWYIDMRLSNPDVPKESLLVQMNTKTGQLRQTGQFREYLQRYVMQVYKLILVEFPHYYDYIVNYDRYDRARRYDAGFEQFKMELKSLIHDPLFINQKIVAPKGLYRRRSYTRRSTSRQRSTKRRRSTTTKRRKRRTTRTRRKTSRH